MSYLDTPHKRKSLIITILLHLVLLLLLFFVGMAVKEPENDGGIAINFGNSEKKRLKKYLLRKKK